MSASKRSGRRMKRDRYKLDKLAKPEKKKRIKAATNSRGVHTRNR